MEYQRNACGLASIPREAFPSMFQILGWSAVDQSKVPEAEQPVPPIDLPTASDNTEGQKVINHGRSKIEYSTQRKKPSKSTNSKYELYYYKGNSIKRSQSQVHCATAESVVRQPKKVQHKKKLDPNNEVDRKQIDARKKRIKNFQYVTRDLPNSAFTTYYGKPTFEAYGRGNSNPNLLTHNVMPHSGTNNPKVIQSYYTALLQGKKHSHSHSTHVPRKPVEETTEDYHYKAEPAIHLPLETPDLINNVRFTSERVDRKKDASIPSHKISPMTQKISKKKAKVQKKKKASPDAKNTLDLDDGLKFMNTRANLLKIIESKKLNASKIAYKVTECYPFEWQNQQKAKQSTHIWQKVVVAGKPSTKGDPVSAIFKPNENVS